NWFLRDEKTGTTRIKTAELDEAGRFGDWPEDFDEVVLEAENRYLSAAEERLAKGGSAWPRSDPGCSSSTPRSPRRRGKCRCIRPPAVAASSCRGCSSMAIAWR